MRNTELWFAAASMLIGIGCLVALWRLPTPPPAVPVEAQLDCMVWEGRRADELVEQILELEDESLGAVVKGLVAGLQERYGIAEEGEFAL